MEQFNILQVVVQVPNNPELTYHKYLNFRNFPEIEVVDKLAASTLLPNAAAIETHSRAFFNRLQDIPAFVRGFLKDHKEVVIRLKAINYNGLYAESLQATTEMVNAAYHAKADKQ